ncbi:MAG: hypothetical protein RIB86_00720 [Imperialibacter sp.]
MSTIKLYAKKDDFTSLPPKSTAISITETAAVIPAYDIHEYNLAGLSIYGFSYQVNCVDSNLALASMTIPAYFEEARVVNGKRVDMHGLFLVNMGDSAGYLKEFFEDKRIFGPFGCPKRVLAKAGNGTGVSKEYFTFNNMRFYPFILPDFTVGYYVCDGAVPPRGGEPRGAWRPYSPDEDGVALDAPVTYDPTLGLYITRASHIEPA